MRALSLLVVSLLSAVAAAELDSPEVIAFNAAAKEPGALEYDHAGSHYVVLPLVPGKFKPKAGNKTDAVLTSRTVLDVLLNRRQACSADYWYCEDIDQCCPTSMLCCSWGYCIDENNACCPNGFCQAGTDCCGYNHCYPVGTQCCGDESYCDAGNNCYKVDGQTQDICCTDDTCTAYVSNGITITRTSSTAFTTPTFPPSFPPTTAFASTTAPPLEAYYFTITWYYYSYYWVRYDSTLSIVTSTREMDSTVISVEATASAEAYSSFSSISSTLLLPTPSDATSLEPLAGHTSTQPVQTLPGGDDSSTSPPPLTTTTPTRSTRVKPATPSTTTTEPKTSTTATTPKGNTASPTSTSPTTSPTSANGVPGRPLSDRNLLTVWSVFCAVTGILMVVL